MVKFSRRRIARELIRLLQEQPNRQAEILRMVAAYLLQTKQAGSAHLLLNDIADELYKEQAILNAEVRSAFSMADATRTAIIAMLKKETNAKAVVLTETVEPELIGGVIIRTPQLQLDASIKRQLTQLAGGIS